MLSSALGLNAPGEQANLSGLSESGPANFPRRRLKGTSLAQTSIGFYCQNWCCGFVSAFCYAVPGVPTPNLLRLTHESDCVPIDTGERK